MYETYLNEQEISLWCLGPEKEDGTTSVSNTNISNKRKLPNADDKQGSKWQAIRDEVEDIFTSLKEKRGSTYNAAQLQLRANMLQIGTHRDYDEPPKVPMFGVTAKTGTKSPCLAEALSKCNVAEGFMHALKSPAPSPSGSGSPIQTPSHVPLQEMGVSPGKCAALRTQYIKQLKELQLLEATAITKEEYEEQKTAVIHRHFSLILSPQDVRPLQSNKLQLFPSETQPLHSHTPSGNFLFKFVFKLILNNRRSFLFTALEYHLAIEKTVKMKQNTL